MSTEHAPSAIIAPPPVPAAASRSRVALLAIALAVGAGASSANLLARPLPADDFSNFAALEPVRDGVWAFSAIGALATALAYVAVGLAVCLLAPARGATWATIGSALTALGGLGYAAGFFAMGAVTWYATADVVPADTGAALLSYVGDHSARVFGPQIAGFLLFVIGYLLLAVALWRSRSVPRWLPIAVPVTFVAAMLAGTGIAFDVVNALFMATLVAVAWYLWTSTRSSRGARG